MVRKFPVALSVMLFASSAAIAADTPDLTSTVTALDAKLFAAYNTCDLDTLGAMVADDLEFYHAER
jgi:hypothetical protein